jgi:hypothetical protein
VNDAALAAETAEKEVTLENLEKKSRRMCIGQSNNNWLYMHGG